MGKKELDSRLHTLLRVKGIKRKRSAGVRGSVDRGRSDEKVREKGRHLWVGIGRGARIKCN